jgi:2-polyprenyl-3-methyl-5-hydroxy-6-metoxy-1,4-benzoquinol methylase
MGRGRTWGFAALALALTLVALMGIRIEPEEESPIVEHPIVLSPRRSIERPSADHSADFNEDPDGGDQGQEKLSAGVNRIASSNTSSKSVVLTSVDGMPITAEDIRILREISPARILTPVEIPDGAGPEEKAALLDEKNYREYKTNSKCPTFKVPSTRTADGKVTQETIIKYSRYVQLYCNNTGLMQMFVTLPRFLTFLDIIANLVKLRPGDRVLDWGCGCGTALNYYYKKFNTTGVGVDFTRSAIDWARAHSQSNQTFCWMDGTNLKFFPAESFDAVVSWAVLYHIRRTLVQCEAMHQIARVLKPGGIAFIGHIRTEKTMEYWKKKNKCPIPGVSIVRLRDYRTLHMPAFKRNQFYSLVVYKSNATSGPMADSPPVAQVQYEPESHAETNG